MSLATKANDLVEEAAEATIVWIATHFRVRHSGEIVAALKSPAGYEAAHPEEFEPLTEQETAEHLGFAEVAVPAKDDTTTAQVPPAPDAFNNEPHPPTPAPVVIHATDVPPSLPPLPHE